MDSTVQVLYLIIWLLYTENITEINSTSFKLIELHSLLDEY